MTRVLAFLPTKRGGGIAVVVAGRVHVLGGSGYHPGQVGDVSISASVPHRALTTHEVYDPVANTWQTRTPFVRRTRKTRDLRFVSVSHMIPL